MIGEETDRGQANAGHRGVGRGGGVAPREERGTRRLKRREEKDPIWSVESVKKSAVNKKKRRGEER